MKLSDVIDVLSKAKQIVGDAATEAEVVLKELGSGNGSVIQRIEVAFVDVASAVANEVTLIHGPAPVNLSPPPANASDATASAMPGSPAAS